MGKNGGDLYFSDTAVDSGFEVESSAGKRVGVIVGSVVAVVALGVAAAIVYFCYYRIKQKKMRESNKLDVHLKKQMYSKSKTPASTFTFKKKDKNAKSKPKIMMQRSQLNQNYAQIKQSASELESEQKVSRTNNVNLGFNPMRNRIETPIIIGF